MINYIKRLYNWFVIPWPLHLFPIFFIVHLAGFAVFSENIDGWNLFSSTSLQLFGGWYVIKTINDNLGIFSGSSIMQSVRDYFKSFPAYKPKSITMYAEGASYGVSFGNAKLTINKKLKTTKEKVEFLFSEIKRLENENRKLKAELVSKIDNLKSSLEDSVRNQKKDIESIQSKVVETMVGGTKEGVLGIFCIFYSLLIPYVTQLMRYLFSL